jgi:hypothetical protein
MNRIEQELRAQQKSIWAQRIKESKFAIGFVLVIGIILSWNIYRSTDKVAEQEHLFGVLVGIHQIQGNLGSSTTMLSIKLNNGQNVMVTAPANLVVRDHAEVEIIRGKTEQGSVYYYFSNYRELK